MCIHFWDTVFHVRHLVEKYSNRSAQYSKLEKKYLSQTRTHLQTVLANTFQKFGSSFDRVCKQSRIRYSVFLVPRRKRETRCIVWTSGRVSKYGISAVSYDQGKDLKHEQAWIWPNMKFCNQSLVGTLKNRLVSFWQFFLSQLHINIY
jgi:hypothetical protein